MLNDILMKYNKLLLLIGVLTTISGCSLAPAQEERIVLKLSSDGKLVYPDTEEDKDDKEDVEEAGEPPEIEISNPMPVREMSVPEMPVPEMSLPDIPVREMSYPEMQLPER